ncbi:hypothetical protein ACFC7A_26855 [Streptomyces niveus]|uniref:hypothetical protein n=1 Tax=Streptomyces niveus TaxID=193462 RepID=UPI0035D55EDC
MTSSNPMHPAVARAADLVVAIFGSVGDGCHHLTVSVGGCGAAVPFHNVGEFTDADFGCVRDVVGLLACTGEWVGGAVVRSECVDGSSRVRGWRVMDGVACPLGRAEVFDAYCTDAFSGELISPVPGMVYLDAPFLVM